MHVSSLISDLRLDCFSRILAQFKGLVPGLSVCVDGGAGLGEATAKILGAVGSQAVSVVAYEPNPDNVKAFVHAAPNLTLVDKALGERDGTARFQVASTTRLNRPENPYLVSGTSFVGKLVASEAPGETEATVFEVPVTRLDHSLAGLGHSRADFVKLDLQGGELAALQGMGALIGEVGWMWIEYSGQEGVLEFLDAHGFVLFDTLYMFRGEPDMLTQELFLVERRVSNSLGNDIFFARRRHVWSDYARGFAFARKHRRMMQTDLVAVSPACLAPFLDACYAVSHHLDIRQRMTIPRALF